MILFNLSFDKAISIPSLKKIASAKIVEWYLWNLEYPEDVIPEEYRGESEYWDKLLAKHREQTIRAAATFTEESGLPSVFRTFFKESVYSYSRAHAQFLRWESAYNSQHEIGDPKANLPHARRYFTVNGEFDDLAWTKRVVLDPRYPITSRFSVACLYCLQNETAKLWSEVRNEPYYGGLIQSIFAHETFELQIFPDSNRPEDLATLANWNAGLKYVTAFVNAAVSGYEHATRYFWDKMVKSERMSLGTLFFHLISGSARHDEKVTFFLYSILSKEQKHELLNFSEYGESGPYVWVNLLLSSYAEAERSEIMELVCKLPFDKYSYVLAKIARGLEEHSYPFDREEVFKTLWIRLTPEERGEVLKRCPCRVRRFIAAIF